jgi:hypothetical protein
MKLLINTLIALALSISTNAQVTGTISGKIKDGGNRKIIEAASISLLHSSDSSLVKTSVADSSGNFSFENVKAGNYLVMASSTGHLNAFSGPFSLTSQSIELGVLQLVAADKNLKEVVIVSKRPFFERRADKMIINVDALISNTGTTAMEVLEKSPGVTVDKDGNISLKGKQGVLVLIDGKQSYLTGTGLADFLRSLPSSNLDQIEIMTNPSAKYDAAGNSGIINIRTKKIKQKGFNGNLTTSFGQGVYPKTNNSLNLNYRINKFNLFTTLSANYRERFQSLEIHRRYTNDDKSTKAVFDQDNFRKKLNRNYKAKLGLDYFASPKTTIGFVLTGISSPGNEVGNNTTYLKNNNELLDSIVAATTTEKYTWKNGGANINFRHRFDSTGRELSADADFLQYKSGKDQFFTNKTYDAGWGEKYSDALRGDLPSDIKVYTVKMDYTQLLKKQIKLEAGAKYSYVTTDNTAGYFIQSNGTETIDYGKTNRFQYRENVNAGYINVSKEIKKWALQAGLRVENTNYEGYQFGNVQKPDSAFKRHYTNAFPTAYISYQADSKNQLAFSYGRRINRPDYEDLNPFLFFLDKYTYGSGNPFLKPMYSQVFDLSHTFKQFLTTTLNYSHTKDLFNETFEEQGFATIVRQGNYGLMNNLNVSISAQLAVSKWWTATLYSEARYQQFKGLLYGEYLDIDNKNLLVHANNQFNFKNGWSAEISGFYRTKGIEGQMIIQPIGEMNIGLQKQVLKNKGSIKCSARDLLYTRRARGNINFQHTEASFRESNDSRVVSISFNYRFGKPIKGLQKRKTGGAGEEQNRVKSAN